MLPVCYHAVKDIMGYFIAINDNTSDRGGNVAVMLCGICICIAIVGVITSLNGVGRIFSFRVVVFWVCAPDSLTSLSPMTLAAGVSDIKSLERLKYDGITVQAIVRNHRKFT